MVTVWCSFFIMRMQRVTSSPLRACTRGAVSGDRARPSVPGALAQSGRAPAARVPPWRGRPRAGACWPCIAPRARRSGHRRPLEGQRLAPYAMAGIIMLAARAIAARSAARLRFAAKGHLGVHAAPRPRLARGRGADALLQRDNARSGARAANAPPWARPRQHAGPAGLRGCRSTHPAPQLGHSPLLFLRVGLLSRSLIIFAAVLSVLSLHAEL